jgi:hypothetical protein
MTWKLLPLMAVPLIGVRVAHSATPSVELAALLWFFASVAMLVGWRQLRRLAVPTHGAIFVGIGAFSNGLVLLVNRGVMPVNGLAPELDGGAWRSAEHGGHLLFLGDYMALGGASPGDLLVFAGLAFTMGAIFVQGLRARRLQLAAQQVS